MEGMSQKLAHLSELAIQGFLGACKAMLPIKEQGGDNHGQMVEEFLKKTGLPGGYAWCCAFVSYLGYWSQYDVATKKSSWPLMLTAGCKELGEDARKKGMLVTTPEIGDIYLKFYPDKAKFSHTGIVIALGKNNRITTIEGNTNDDGSRNGDSVKVKQRDYDIKIGDRFVRWTKALETLR